MLCSAPNQAKATFFDWKTTGGGQDSHGTGRKQTGKRGGQTIFPRNGTKTDRKGTGANNIPPTGGDEKEFETVKQISTVLITVLHPVTFSTLHL